MNLYPYIKLVLLSFTLFLLTAIDVLSCGPMPDPYANRVTFFNPELFPDTTYRAIYWESNRYLNQTPWDATLAQKHSYNVSDWYRYFKQTPDKEDIALVVYKSDTLLLQRLYNQIAYGKPYNITDAEWKNNELLQYLYKTKDIDAINYLVIAKRCEPFVVSDPWGEKETNSDDIEPLINTIIIKYKNCRTPFIRLRYAYQAIRLALYSGRYEQAIQLYTKYASGAIGKQTEDSDLIANSVIRPWTMALRAGAHKRLGQYGPAMYGFSRVFIDSPDKKQMALQNFEYTGEQDWEQAINIASRRPGSASILWMLRGLKNKQLDLEPLRKMYEDLPNSQFLEAMLVREINKIEELLLSPAMTQAVPMGKEDTNLEKASFTTSSKNTQASIWENIKDFFRGIWNTIVGWFSSSDNGDNAISLVPKIENTTYIQEYKAFVDTARLAGNVNDPHLWSTVSAYLSYLLQSYDEANTALNQVINNTDNPRIQDQAILVRSLVNLAEKGKMDASLEGSFQFALRSLPQPDQSYENFNVYSRTLMYIAQHYLLQGDLPKAILCFNRAKETDAAQILADFHASQTDLEALRQLAAKPNKSAFEAHLFEDSLFTEDLILDIMASKLMREQQFEAALKKYQQISPEYWQSSEEKETWFGLAYNEFPCSTEQNSLSDEPITERCNKMEFAEKVVNLLQKAKTDPAESYFKLGNIFSNTPFWGYTGNLWQGGLIWTLREFEEPLSGEYGIGAYPFNMASLTDTLQNSIDHFVETYGTRDVAAYYYKEAMENAENNQRELGAKSAYMALYCQQNPLASIHNSQKGDSTIVNVLVKKYGDTQFFGEIIQECPNLSSYQ